MPLCCIGGVCIPYSAILPIVIYGVQWILQKLACAGLLPDALCRKLQGLIISPLGDCSNKQNLASDTSKNSKCCAKDSSLKLRRGKQAKYSTISDSTASTDSFVSTANDATETSEIIAAIESKEAWDRLLTEKPEKIIICKFTATWCKPCKEIQPLFISLSKSSCQSTKGVQNKFVVVDVDVMDDVASDYRVVSLPMFVAIQNGRVLDKYSGSNPDKVQAFVESALKIQNTSS